MKSSKCKKSSKKSDDLPPILEQIYYFLKITPTLKFVIKKTNKDKRLVARDIKRLIDKGYIKRIDRGVYKVIKKLRLLNPSHQKKSSKRYWRGHKLRVVLRQTLDNHRIVRNTILKKKEQYNVREFGNAGYWFDYEFTGLVTKKNLYIYFPENYNFEVEDINTLPGKMDNAISQIAKKWENRFKIKLFKDERINYEIIDLHIAFIDGNIIKELTKREINNLTIYDKEDGKRRFIIDKSKGFPEPEFVHPEKQFDDAYEFEKFMESLNKGEYREFQEKIPQMEKAILLLTEIQTGKQIQPEEPEEPIKQRKIPEYIG